MHVLFVASAVSALLSSAFAWTPDSTLLTGSLAVVAVVKQGLFTLHDTCNLSTASLRREWHTLSNSQKTSYISAVQCLQGLPSISGGQAPGAKSRYDDFVAVHIAKTLTIHGTGNFLSWHRYFVWTYEQALRKECGYTGYQPYLDWSKLASDPLAAPVFDGSGTSMSGNGAYKESAGVSIPSPAAPFIQLPPQQGGGCVTSGPFANMEVNLGPMAPVFTDIPANPQADGLGYNPRCLRRDISQYVSSMALTDKNVSSLITSNNNIGDFQNVLQGNFAAGEIGVHTAGHYLTGGDPGGDIFSSPGDPYFFLHHAAIDRTWWIWQNQKPSQRTNVIAGTITLLNNPPSRDATLQDQLDLGVLAAEIPISSAVSTLGGPFCYYYL